MSTNLEDLAGQLDCLTDEQLGLVTDTKPGTREHWRKTGSGPAYCMAGNRVLYPRAAVTEWLKTRLRERRHLPVETVL